MLQVVLKEAWLTSIDLSSVAMMMVLRFPVEQTLKIRFELDLKA